MIKNYIKIAIRNLLKQRGYSLINILGLSMSLAVALLMLLWVEDELSVDRFHANGDNIYRIKRTIPLEGNSLDVYNGIPYPVLVAAQNELPEIERYIPLGRSFDESIEGNNNTYRETGTFGNAAYFESFSFPVIIGDIRTLDKKVKAIAISKKMARKVFGNLWESNSLGETIHIHDIGDFIIEAVYADFPANSMIQNEFVYSFNFHLKSNEWMHQWTNSGMQGAIVLAEGADPDVIAGKIDKIYRDHQESDRKEGILLQKYSDHYLYGKFDEQANVSGGRIAYVRTFAIAAFLLLFIACINFVNLSTARASKRAKEVGVRKTIGAGKNSLMVQFLIEAGLITFVSIILAYVMALIALPRAQQVTDKMLAFDLSQPVFWFGILSIFIFTSILSGAYPAFVLSAFRPINVLKSSVTHVSNNSTFRKGLVVVQFVLALLLIVGALVVQQQVEFIKIKNLGINKDNLLALHQTEKITQKYEALRNELLTHEEIAGVTVAGPNPLNMQASTSNVGWPGKSPDQENIEFQLLWTASNFIDVFNVSLAEGRFYREDSFYDTSSVVFNKKAIATMGLTDPIGQTIQLWGAPRQIIGIVDDFHNRSLYEEIKPAGILLDVDNAGWVFVKAEEGMMSGAISSLESSFGTVLPDEPVHFDFVDEQYQQFYKSEELTSTLASYFAIISILLSCLGLLGLATFFAEQKNNEIGIRKVLGASFINLIGLLSKEFITLVAIGLILGIPISWYLLHDWLEKFEYNVNLEFWMFALPILLTIVIAGLTVGLQASRAALLNPIKSLRSE